MTGKANDIDFEKAILDPAAVFSSPDKLCDREDLTRAQKIEILRRWTYDASELAVAEEEGMTGGESSHLAKILSLLDSLTGGYDVEHTPPTKQDGVSVSTGKEFMNSVRHTAKGGTNMDSGDASRIEREFHELTGAVDALAMLKEKLELRLEEGRDDCVREVFDNVIALIDSQGIEYQRRLDEKHAQMQIAAPNKSDRC